MRRLTLAFVLAALAACSGGSPAPEGWKNLANAPAVWVNGPPAARQTYAYVKEPFQGTLQDLAQREIVNTTLQNRGIKFVKSDVYSPCPGVAALATFAGAGQTAQVGFAVAGGSAIVVRYSRPSASHDDPAAIAAMQRALCVAPA